MIIAARESGQPLPRYVETQSGLTRGIKTIVAHARHCTQASIRGKANARRAGLLAFARLRDGSRRREVPAPARPQGNRHRGILCLHHLPLSQGRDAAGDQVSVRHQISRSWYICLPFVCCTAYLTSHTPSRMHAGQCTTLWASSKSNERSLSFDCVNASDPSRSRSITASCWAETSSWGRANSRSRASSTNAKSPNSSTS